MIKKLYVGNLPFSTTADDLLEAFGNFGTVTQAQVVSDRETGRSRGFARSRKSADLMKRLKFMGKSWRDRSWRFGSRPGSFSRCSTVWVTA